MSPRELGQPTHDTQHSRQPRPTARQTHSQLRAPRIITGYVEPGSESLNAVEPPWLAVIDGICSDEERHYMPPGAEVSIPPNSAGKRKN